MNIEDTQTNKDSILFLYGINFILIIIAIIIEYNIIETYTTTRTILLVIVGIMTMYIIPKIVDLVFGLLGIIAITGIIYTIIKIIS
jgi:hypothetical protein